PGGDYPLLAGVWGRSLHNVFFLFRQVRLPWLPAGIILFSAQGVLPGCTLDLVAFVVAVFARQGLSCPPPPLVAAEGGGPWRGVRFCRLQRPVVWSAHSAVGHNQKQRRLRRC
ncbi:MAG: hypothetical protein H7836_15095, partial [Magnetococcus sp. YQC-3]